MTFLIITFAVAPSNQVQAAPPTEIDSLRAAIRDLTDTFGSRYPRGERYLQRLAKIEQRLAYDKQIEPATRELENLRREALIANPLVSNQPILFVVRAQYRSDHHNTATMFQNQEINTGSFVSGGAIKTIDFTRGGKVTTLREIPTGIARDPEVSFDGNKILFSMRRDIEDDYHIYEMNADGTEIKQLTFGREVSDIDPVYLPDGKIVLTATREPKYCMCNRHIMGNLFKMDADGANMHQIDRNTLHSGHGFLMEDGRILYDRWEYVDRNFGDAQGLWTVNPDGTNPVVYWGNNSGSPGAVLDARTIPDTQQVICIFSSCHDRPWGALAIIDRRLGMDGRQAVVRTWPANAINLVNAHSNNNWDAFLGVRPKYEDPYPLSKKYFLCARMTGRGEKMGIYLVDIFGNEILLHTESAGCYDPMPLASRLKPGVIPARRKFNNEPGYFYLVNAYEGTHMKGVKEGAVKYLRVVESPPKKFWSHPAWGGQGQHAPGMNWHNFENKRILGTVPVEKDGSVYVEVPADKFVFFQLLDEKGMMIHSMRSGTTVQPGETTGCIGCHENRVMAPPQTTKVPLALQREPSPLQGWYGPPRKFSFQQETQPVFDRHCVSCHDFGKEGQDLLLSGDRTNTFSFSYNELWRKGYTAGIGGGPAQVQQAYSWGSHASKLIAALRKEHYEVQLSPEDFDRIVTWIDINAPYYPYYASAYPDNLSGRSPLTNQQMARLSKLTGVNLNGLANHNRRLGPQVSFDRPELSPCLANIKDNNSAEYHEALTIIRAGKEMLTQRPRADMPGFAFGPVDQRRQNKYDILKQAETDARQAILAGSRNYNMQQKDTPSP
jgi:hypothetical protein